MSRQINEITSNNLRRYRKLRCLRQRDVANTLGLKNIKEINRWEHGKTLPSLVNVLKLSFILKCPVEILFLNHFQSIKDELSYNKRE